MKVWCRQRDWAAALLLLAGSWVAYAAPWFPLGPYGGDARSIAADPQDPKHLYLGTETGWIYDSHDGGVSWQRISHIENRNNLVIDHIVVDARNPKRLIAGAYAFDHLDGGLYISEDSGRNWYSQAQMRGQSIRSLARSTSDPMELIAGTMSGVFRSKDNARHWTRISPEDNKEIHEVESVAIDPTKPDVIYAGTWHLPWKSEDGGASWKNIKQGIIDDSDVFSIIVDPDKPETVYASACSGIYKSENGGDSFRKIQGIPSTARRTRKLAQDPSDVRTVFAGTTEGLYRTLDAGANWTLLTGKDVIVNDVYIDPTNAKHVLMATDRGGVLRSEDGGETFEPSNQGFSARQVHAFAADAKHPSTLYVGVVNDKEAGGVFVSQDDGIHWKQQSDGLKGSDIFSLGSSPDGTMLAGTAHGVYRLEDGAWVESSARAGATPKSETAAAAPALEAAPPASTPAKQAATKTKPSAAVHKPAAKTPSRPATHRPVRHIEPVAFFIKQKPVAKGKKASKKIVSEARANPGRTRKQATTMHPKPVGASSKAFISAPSAGASKTVDAVVYSIASEAGVLYAGTSQGLFVGSDEGRLWTPITTLEMPEIHNVTVLPPAEGKSSGPGAGKLTLLAAGLKRLALSLDGGATWDTVPLPGELTQINAVAVDGLRNLWVGGREGVWYSTDYGENWKSIKNLFVTDVDGLFYDPVQKRVFVTADSSSVAFAASLPDYKVSYWDTGWRLRFVRPAGDHLIGATMYDGMVVEPKMVDSPMEKSAGASR